MAIDPIRMESPWDSPVDERRLTALAAAFQAGDDRSFRILVESLTRPLIAMAYRYTRDWEWSRDLTQETWIKVYERIDRYDPSLSFRTWLFTVHRNGCLTHLRKAWVRQEHLIDDEERSALYRVPDPGDLDADLDRLRFHGQILRALGQLSESHRQVFVRVDLENGEQRDVADELGMKPATLRSTLHFARKRIAGILRRMEELP